jgi:hypothetical protein
MQFRIQGVNRATGVETSLTVVARDEEEAEAIAQRTLIVSEVAPVADTSSTWEQTERVFEVHGIRQGAKCVCQVTAPTNAVARERAADAGIIEIKKVVFLPGAKPTLERQPTTKLRTQDTLRQIAADVRVIKGWVTFMGALVLLGIVLTVWRFIGDVATWFTSNR